MTRAYAQVLFSLVAIILVASQAPPVSSASRAVPTIRPVMAMAGPSRLLPVEPETPAPIARDLVAEAEANMLYAMGEGAMPTAKEQPNRAKAYLQAKAYAKMCAIASLVQEAKGTMIEYCATGEDFAADARIKQQINGMLDCVQVVSAKKRPEGKDTIVEVTVRAPKPQPPEPAKISEPCTPTWATGDEGAYKTSSSGGYTSVIIDAQGLRIAKSMSPKIVRSDGSEVWGTIKVDMDTLCEYGIAAYARTRGEAFANRRAGSRPLVIRALGRGHSPSKADAVVSDYDAEALLTADRASHFLSDLRVVFVVGP